MCTYMRAMRLVRYITQRCFTMVLKPAKQPSPRAGPLQAAYYAALRPLLAVPGTSRLGVPASAPGPRCPVASTCAATGNCALSRSSRRIICTQARPTEAAAAAESAYGRRPGRGAPQRAADSDRPNLNRHRDVDRPCFLLDGESATSKCQWYCSSCR